MKIILNFIVRHETNRPDAAGHAQGCRPRTDTPEPNAIGRGLPEPSAIGRGLPEPSAIGQGLPEPSVIGRGGRCRLGIGLFFGLVLAASCGDDGGGADSGNGRPTLDRTPVLESVADRVVLPAIRAAQQAFANMEQAAVSARDGGDRAGLQAAWRQASLSFQALEMMQFGPLGDLGGPSAGAPRGGRGLRDEIYSWPVVPVSLCAIDQIIANDADRFEAPDFFETQLANVYGLDGIEYLAFVDTTDNACPDTADINADGTWDGLEDSEIGDRRARLAAAQASFLNARVGELAEAWEQTFRDDFVSAGDGSSVFSSGQAAFDDVYAAMNQLDLLVKDDKLGIPLGIHAECLEATCPDRVESRYAGASREFIRANVEAFRRLFLGGQPEDPSRHGFDTYLRDIGRENLANDLVQDMDAMVEAAQDVEPPLPGALSSDAERLRTLHTAISDVTTTLKSQFVSVLALRVPQEGAADND